jgi:hypothetical protein
MLLEHHLDLQTDGDVLELAADDVRGEAGRWIFSDGHHGDHVGRRESRQPLLMVHGEAHDGRTSRYRHHRHLDAVALRADRLWWVVVAATRMTSGDPEPAVGAAGPERLAADARVRQGPHHRLGGAGLRHHTSDHDRRTRSTPSQ